MGTLEDLITNLIQIHKEHGNLAVYKLNMTTPRIAVIDNINIKIANIKKLHTRYKLFDAFISNNKAFTDIHVKGINKINNINEHIVII